MKLHFVIFTTIVLTLGVATPGYAEETPDLDSLQRQAPPSERPIEIQTEEKQVEESYEIASSFRNEHIFPSNWGEAGIFRIRSAESLPEGALTFGIGGEFYSISDAPNFGTGSNANTIAETLFVGYSPTQHLTLSVNRRNSSTTFGEPKQLISSLGDFNFSAMYSFPLGQSFALAPIVDFLVASNFNSLAPATSTLSFGIGAAATYTLYPSLGVPLYLHANLIYHNPQIRTSGATLLAAETYYSFSRYNTVTFGLGAEYKAGDFIPFVEFHQTMHTDSALNYSNSPMVLTVGSRFTPLSNKSLALLLGVDIGMVRGQLAGAPVPGVPFTPGYQVIGQVSYTFGVTQTERKHYFTTQDVNVVDRKFVIKKNVRFKVGKAELERESTSLLDQIAEVIRQNNVKRLMIAGHTDSTHTEEYNLKLSQDRANTVKRYLVGKGIPEDSLVAQGFGKRKPKASNNTESGRQLNRRVEFFILE